ncbi:hypothetical protein WR25_15144 [Diploscapter pachys]|uniref:Uncharacterized protein n=1 Tax=Diploscapter pachys TaxID=2018661 RepID=A0A2A2K421_9BILA|nr:hypothetical protein WR25_15144 [Diploscapter pachys]
MNVALLISIFIHLSRAYNQAGEKARILEDSFERDISALDTLIDEIEAGKLSVERKSTTHKPRIFNRNHHRTTINRPISVFKDRVSIGPKSSEEYDQDENRMGHMNMNER